MHQSPLLPSSQTLVLFPHGRLSRHVHLFLHFYEVPDIQKEEFVLFGCT